MTTLAKQIADRLQFTAPVWDLDEYEDKEVLIGVISESLAAHSAKLQRLVTAAEDIAGSAPAIEALRSKGFTHTARILEADIARLRAALADMKEVENGVDRR